jgi:TetR/AcrR family transcriptional repressor of nem operon
MIVLARPKAFDKETALQKAMNIFWSKGYDGTSISELTAAMKISRSSMYETFGDKETLFCEALTYYLELNGKRRDYMLNKAASVKQGLQDFFGSVIVFLLSDNYPNGCFYTNTITSLGTLQENVHEILRLAAQQREDSLYTLFERGQRSGEIQPDKDIRALARFFEAAVRGISVAANIQKDRKALDDIVKVALEVLD